MAILGAMLVRDIGGLPCTDDELPDGMCDIAQGTSLLSHKQHVSVSPIIYGEDSAVEWVPLGLVSPDLGTFTNHLSGICHKRRSFSQKELDDIELLSNSAAVNNKPYHLLAFALNAYAPKKGLYLEFGVASGRSANITGHLVGAFQGGEASKNVNMVNGFDTFEGLPEAWGDRNLGAGTFRQSGGLPPPVLDNVRLHKGLFNDTLPGFLAQHPDEPLAFANIDCDLYAGAIQVLNLLQRHLVPGSVIHFHELVHLSVDKLKPEDEMKALHDFLLKPENKGLDLEVLNVVDGAFSEPVVLRVTGIPPHVGPI